MNHVSQLIYFAEILPRFASLFGWIGGIGLVASAVLGIIILSAVGEGADEIPKGIIRTSIIAPIVSLLLIIVACFIPSRETILMIAASEFTESALATPAGKRLTGLAGRTADVLETFLNKTEAKLVAETPKEGVN